MNYTMHYNWSQFELVYRENDLFRLGRRDEVLIDEYADHLVNEVYNFDDLREIAYEYLVDAMFEFSNEKLVKEVKEFAPHLLRHEGHT